jgi:predicted nucleic-acid-binding protein
MTGIDTKVLVRYLVQDDPEQARKATRFITNECASEDPGFINRIGLSELVWVLETAYGYAREQVSLALGKILRTAHFEIEGHQEA